MPKLSELACFNRKRGEAAFIVKLPSNERSCRSLKLWPGGSGVTRHLSNLKRKILKKGYQTERHQRHTASSRVKVTRKTFDSSRIVG